MVLITFPTFKSYKLKFLVPYYPGFCTELVSSASDYPIAKQESLPSGLLFVPNILFDLNLRGAHLQQVFCRLLPFWFPSFGSLLLDPTHAVHSSEKSYGSIFDAPIMFLYPFACLVTNLNSSRVALFSRSSSEHLC